MVHISHPGPEHWKALVLLIGYINVKETKCIIIIKLKVLKAVMFCDSNYSTDKETRKSVSGLVSTLGGTLPTCSPKTQRNVTLSRTEEEYVALPAWAQEVKFVSMFLGEMTKVENISAIYEDNQGGIFLAKNRHVGIHTNHIDISHHFLREMVEEKDIDIQYIRSEENPYDIMNNNTPEVNFARHIQRITEGELWEIVDTGRENFKKIGVTDDFIVCDKTKCSIHAPSVVVDGTNRNE